MSETLATIAALRTRKVAIEEEMKLAQQTQKEHEAKAREASALYFAKKQERQQVDEALRSHNATLIEEQAVSAAQQAQQHAEAAKTEAAATLDQLKAQQAALVEKEKKLDELIAKAEAAAK